MCVCVPFGVLYTCIQIYLTQSLAISSDSELLRYLGPYTLLLNLSSMASVYLYCLLKGSSSISTLLVKEKVNQPINSWTGVLALDNRV